MIFHGPTDGSNDVLRRLDKFPPGVDGYHSHHWLQRSPALSSGSRAPRFSKKMGGNFAAWKKVDFLGGRVVGEMKSFRFRWMFLFFKDIYGGDKVVNIFTSIGVIFTHDG